MPSLEVKRLAALREQNVLDTPAEDRFDRLTAMASAHFRCPIALVSLVDSDRQWFKSCVGLPVDETPRSWAFCDHAIRGEPGSVMVVCDATGDPRFADNPLVTGEPFIRFYAGAVLTTKDGHNLGTLCVIDTVARKRPSDADLVHLQSLAKLVVDQFELGQAKKNLAEQKRLLDLAEAMSEVGYWTLKTDIRAVFWSPQVYRIHGVDPAEFDPSLDDALAFYVDSDRARISALLSEKAADGEGWSFDADLTRRSDGSLRHVRSTAVCEHDSQGRVVGFFGVFKDLTDERQALAKSAEREKHFRVLANSARDIIAAYGPDGVFSYLSPSVTEVLGYSPEELIGRTPYSIMHPDDHDRVAAEFLEGSRSEAPTTIEYRAITRDGTVRWLEARPRFQHDETGHILEIHDTVRDVTERREREVDLAQARFAAEQASRAKAAFLANMSHEIRTPLNGLLGFAEVLADTALEPGQRHYLDRIRSAGGGLSDLINDVLDYSKIEAGKMPLEDRPVDLKSLLDEVIDLTVQANRDRLTFSMGFPDGISPWISGDRQRVRQVLFNLLGNAAKFTPRGSVHTEVSIDGGQVEIRISDTGIGISPEALTGLFDSFTQADPTIGRRFGGSGLGLAISRSLAQLMGGDVALESEEKVGTTAIFQLPHRPAPAPVSAPPRSRLKAPPTRSLRVLVVDDVEANLELIEIMLSRAGHAVTGVESGPAALDLMAAGESFDLILMDVQMPGMDGLETTRRIRGMGDSGAEVPIVALTANVLPDQILDCRVAGMDDHLAKPIAAGQLAELLARVCRLGATFGGAAHSGDEEDDPVAELRARYAAQLKVFKADFERIGRLPAEEQPRSIAALSHAIAGTAGSLGFPQVSKAAFDLEAAARSCLARSAGPEVLTPLVGVLVSTFDK